MPPSVRTSIESFSLMQRRTGKSFRVMARETVSCYRAPRKQTPIKFSVQSFSELKKKLWLPSKTRYDTILETRDTLYRRRGLVYLRFLNLVHFLCDGHDWSRKGRFIRLSTGFIYETTKLIYVTFVIGQLHTHFCYKNLIVISKVKKVKLFLWQVVEAHMVVRRRGSHIF
jgi:hypothetical protein